MRLSRTIYSLGMCLTLLPISAQAKDKPIEELNHARPWVARFDNNACHLIGEFGSGSNAVNLRFTRFAPGDAFELWIYGERARSKSPMLLGGWTFKPEARIAREPKLAGITGKLPMIMLGSGRLDDWRGKKESDVPPAITPDFEAGVTSIDIHLEGKPRFRVLTGSMAKPMATMRSCIEGLVKSWGFDPSVQISLSRKLEPVGSPGKWLTSEDYPEAALESRHNGLVNFRVDVDASGKVEQCHILAATKPTDFEKATCAGIIKRARFVPALDAKGNPVRSFHVNAVRWLTSY